jgi:adenylate cyclase
LVEVTVSDDPMVAADSRLAVAPGNTMAVLPFENLSANSADSVFLNGLHNDLLTRLARQQSLHVQSRASVLKYRNTKKDSRAIGSELNVATILTGSIQRSGSAVRINVRLVDAHSEKHIWAEIYDRQLNPENLISLQSEVTTAIVAALNRKLAMMKADAQISSSKT